MISYYNIIAAKLAKINLHGQRAGSGLLEVSYAPCKEGREFSEGAWRLPLVLPPAAWEKCAHKQPACGCCARIQEEARACLVAIRVVGE